MKSLLDAALWYARNGKYVFPLAPGTKDPLKGSHGLYDATTDQAQIRRWWKQNPNYNIGINCGKSGLLVLEADRYKENYRPLPFALPDTVEARSAHNGTHLWYQMPSGKHYGNANNTLPPGNDIRGYGGYIVAPPSVLVEDGTHLPYTYAPKRNPADIAIALLPDALAKLLDAAQATSKANNVCFAATVGNQPNLSQWRLSAATLTLIRDGHPKRCDRSAIDQKIITSLVIAGCSDDEIRAVFTHFAIGAKYKERGDKYLARSIGKAHAYVGDHAPAPAPPLLPQLERLREWVQGPEFMSLLRAHKGIGRPADVVKSMIAIVNRAIEHRAPRVLLSCRQLGELTGLSHMSAKRHLSMLGEGITIHHQDQSVSHKSGLNLVSITDDPAGYGKLVDLAQLLQIVTPLHTGSKINERCNNSQQFANSHLPDEAFISYPHRFALKMRPNAEILPHGLSSPALLIAAILSECGELPRSAISQLTGLSSFTTGKWLRRLATLGLLLIHSGKPYRYELHPNFEAILDDLRPHLPSYQISKRRKHTNAEARRRFVNLLLTAPEPPAPPQEAKLRARGDKYQAQKQALIEDAAGNGVDITARLLERKPPKEVIKHKAHIARVHDLHSTGERVERKAKEARRRLDEWASCRPIYEEWQRHQDVQIKRRYRIMHYAGYTRQEIDRAIHLAKVVAIILA